MSTKDRKVVAAKDELQLMARLWETKIKNNMLAFVMTAFPWGEEGSPLARYSGPRKWQRKLCKIVSEHVLENERRIANGQLPKILKMAICSGRGIGKTAFLAWLCLWMMSTRMGSTTIVTANTEQQLLTRTWPELGRWHTLAINRHWFDRQAMSLKPAPWFKQALEDQMGIDSGYYYANATTWSEENPDAFVGAHNHLGECVIFDEASGIPRPMWTATEGFFTEPIADRYWFVFSNGRRNTGEFYECFHKNRDYWVHEAIDSRTVEDVDIEHLQSIIERYGEDSDEAAIEVKGLFPSQGDSQFIPRSLIMSAVHRDVRDDHSPLIMGIDPARKGRDKTVIRWRQGRNGRVLPPTKLVKCDNMEVVAHIRRLIAKHQPDAIACDVGQGTGIIDRLRELKYRVHEVAFGSKADDERFADRRTEMYHKMKEWLYFGCIDYDTDLIEDLAAPELGNDRRTDRPRLQSKEELRALGHASPDDADAFAVTFDIPMLKVKSKLQKSFQSQINSRSAVVKDYDPHRALYESDDLKNQSQSRREKEILRRLQHGYSSE